MKLKFILIFYLLLTFHLIWGQANMTVIPLPQKYVATGDAFDLKQVIKIYCDEAYNREGWHLQKELLKNNGITAVMVEDKKQANIQLLHTGTPATKGAYVMRMNDKVIILSAADDEGIFNAIASLIQLVTTSDNNQMHCWNIDDAPLYQWRGFMLDESRHFFGKEKVKQLLDYMAFYKLNRFHWHLTDEPGWRIEIKKYPMLTFTGGVGNFVDANAHPRYYTQEEIKEIVAYAAERKIEVIPEIDMPGHARAANRAYPQFSGGGSERYPEFTFDPGNEKTYQYLTDILKEVDVLFPSQMIHLGGDEVHFGNEAWSTNAGVKRLMEKENMQSLTEVEKYFMVRMADSLFARNNKLLAWDEMAEISLPVDKTIIFWWRHDRKDQLKKAFDKNYNLVLCPRIPFYFDFVQDEQHKTGRRWGKDFSDLQKVYAFTADTLVDEKQRKQILGIQANLWTETVGTENRLDYMVFPRLSALAEAAWGQNKQYENYLDRLKSHLKLYKKSGLYYFNPFEVSENYEPKY